MNHWQPIATAPKDRAVLVCNAHRYRPIWARWADTDVYPPMDWWAWRDQDDCVVFATHWQELPEPPEV